jgi:hypothetical protein
MFRVRDSHATTLRAPPRQTHPTHQYGPFWSLSLDFAASFSLCPLLLLQPPIHPLRNLKIILLHEEHMPIPPNPLLTQVRKLDIHANLLQIFDYAVYIGLLERCLTRNNKLWDPCQVRQLLRWLLLHDALVVIGVNGRLDDSFQIRRIRACRRFVSDGEVSEAKGQSWVCSKWRSGCKGRT